MKILKNVYYNLLERCFEASHESGGILGGRDGIISNYAHDYIGVGSAISYVPNVDFFNAQIARWQNKNINFYGIYHSHHISGTLLSNADKEYITCILSAFPADRQSLYFPIVCPRNSIIPYRATLMGGELKILKEDIVLV